jgi:hypothetical protein
MNSEKPMESDVIRETEILTTDYRMNADRGLEENVRLCSLMFAYVRFIGEKCLRRRMVNAVQSCKMHDKRRWGLVELAPPSTRGNVWRGRNSISVERVGCGGMLNG